MRQPVRLELEGSIECNFSSFKIHLDAQDINRNTATFELPIHNYDAKTMLRPDLVKGLKAKVYMGEKLMLTGELELPERKTDLEDVSISLSVKSNSAKTKSTAIVKTGDMLNAKTSDILKELGKNAGVKIKIDEIEDDTVTRFTTTGLTKTDRELHLLTRDRGIHIYENAEGEIVASQKGYNETGCDLVHGVHFHKIISKFSDEKSSNKNIAFGGRNLSAETDFEASFSPNQEKKSKLNNDGLLYIFASGDQTPKSLKSRAIYEANRRATADNEVTITIPSLLAPSGEVWLAMNKHRIVSPPHGLDDELVIKTVDLHGAKETYEATLKFAPVTGFSNKENKGKVASKSKVNEIVY
jgi:prophage tail gpP-like protein